MARMPRILLQLGMRVRRMTLLTYLSGSKLLVIRSRTRARNKETDDTGNNVEEKGMELRES